MDTDVEKGIVAAIISRFSVDMILDSQRRVGGKFRVSCCQNSVMSSTSVSLLVLVTAVDL